MSRMRMATVAATLALALGAAACGDDSSSDGDSGGAVGAQAGGAATEAATQGRKDAGAKVQLPKRTVGYLQYTNEAEVARRMQTAAEQAAKAIGWGFISCDGQGDPRKQGACGSTLLDRGADVIVANTIPPAAAKRAMATAKDRGIPWIVVGGVVEPDPLMGAMYPPDDRAMGDALSEWLVDELGSGEQELAVVNQFPGIEGYKLREAALRDALKSNPDAKIVAEEEVDYTKLVEDVQRDINQVLSKSPDVDALYSLTNDIPPIVTALRSKGKTPEDGPLVVGFFGDKANLDAIRAGTADAIAEWPLEADVWAAVDLAAQAVARDEPLPKSLDGVYSLDFAQPIVVSSENLPPEGEYAAPAADFVSYFEAKWGDEFGAKSQKSGGGGS